MPNTWTRRDVDYLRRNGHKGPKWCWENHFKALGFTHMAVRDKLYKIRTQSASDDVRSAAAEAMMAEAMAGRRFEDARTRDGRTRLSRLASRAPHLQRQASC